MESEGSRKMRKKRRELRELDNKGEEFEWELKLYNQWYKYKKLAVLQKWIPTD